MKEVIELQQSAIDDQDNQMAQVPEIISTCLYCLYQLRILICWDTFHAKMVATCYNIMCMWGSNYLIVCSIEATKHTSINYGCMFHRTNESTIKVQ